MYGGIFGRAEIPPKEERLDSPQELRVDRHYIFKLTVLWTVLPHDYAAIFFKDLRLDFARVFKHQGFERCLT
jgi:hypothetical protein